MTAQTIRIATRKSPLAMWQAEFVKAQLEEKHPGVTVELVPMMPILIISTKNQEILTFHLMCLTSMQH